MLKLDYENLKYLSFYWQQKKSFHWVPYESQSRALLLRNTLNRYKWPSHNRSCLTKSKKKTRNSFGVTHTQSFQCFNSLHKFMSCVQKFKKKIIRRPKTKNLKLPHPKS